ncbi:MAG: divalent-cation tolerance protein CutA [Nitrospirota bacterium]
MAEEIVILITASSPEEGAKIAQALVAEHLVACVNCIPGVRSFFLWEGKAQDAAEVLLVCKSRMVLMEKVMERVKSLHSYTVPEIIALPIAAGSSDYLAWVNDSTKG